LVHEAYVRLFKGHDQSAISRTHFFRLSARAMREVLVEHARGRVRLKRGGENQPVALVDHLVAEPLQEKTVLQLNDSLAELEKVAPRAAEVVEMRFFAGMTEEEIAEGLGISGSTVKREWTFARAWLNARLSER
jgi:RNA polymerase sigma factor (TIGR02999 family)